MGIFSRLNPFKSSQPSPPQKQARRFFSSNAFARSFYDAASEDRLTQSWGTTPLTADEIIVRNQRILVARSREQANNNDYARAFIRMCVANIVGPRGIMLQAQAKDKSGRLDDEINDALEAAWLDWGKRLHCDIAGQQSFRSLCGSAVRSAVRDGEFFFRKILGKAAGKWRFALQQIDPQRCPPDFNEVKLQNGNFIRAGIEFNEYGRAIAYYFTTTKSSEADYIYGGRAYLRIPAEEIIHGFVPDMVSQRRGIPWMATALWRMQMLNGFEKAALVNARVSAAKGGFFQWKEGYGPEHDEDDELTMDAEPGSFQELPAGVEFKEFIPQYPNGEFAPFQKTQLRAMASGWGVLYNNLTSDLEGVNYSSIRQGTLNEREQWKELQEWLIEQFLQPAWDAWLPIALLVGITTASGKVLQITPSVAVSWQGRRWTWVDPRADADAAVTMKNNFMASPGQLLRELGKDPDGTWKEWARDIQAMKDAGIPENFIAVAMGIKADTATKPAEPPPEDTETQND